MNGAIADPSAKINNIPVNNRTIITGINQNFFRSIKKLNKSFMVSIYNIFSPYRQQRALSPLLTIGKLI